jgi:predicted transcriptional regulator
LKTNSAFISRLSGFEMCPVVDLNHVSYWECNKENHMADEALLTLTADIVSAHVGNNNVAVSDLPTLISKTYEALAGLGGPGADVAPVQEPAVTVRASVKPDYIVCLEDGKKLKMLKRHLMTHYQMTPAEYRAKWNLPGEYPMVAPNYAAQRQALALKIGLGRKKGEPAPVAKAGGRKPKATA